MQSSKQPIVVPSVDEISAAVTTVWDVFNEDLTSRKRGKTLDDARRGFVLLCTAARDMMSAGDIAKVLGGRDHSTVWWLLRSARDAYRENDRFVAMVHDAAEKLGVAVVAVRKAASQ